MKYGVVFPQTEIGSDPIAIKDLVQTAEELGYSYLLAYDHVLGANRDRPSWANFDPPYDHNAMFHEVFVLFGYLAGLTKTIQMATGILIAPQRQTALIAKQAATIDVLSNGRLRLGIAIGWNDVEYEALGMDFSRRGKRIEKQVDLLRQLWTQPLVTTKGESEFVNDAGLNPLPVQQPIPIWMGGSADVVLCRMARMADGWFVPGGDIGTTKSLIETIHQYLKAEGRDPKTFGLEQRIYLGNVPESDWGQWISQREATGIHEIGIYPAGDNPQQLMESITQFHKEIIS